MYGADSLLKLSMSQLATTEEKKFRNSIIKPELKRVTKVLLSNLGGICTIADTKTWTRTGANSEILVWVCVELLGEGSKCIFLDLIS